AAAAPPPAPSGPREIALSSMDDEPELPAPKTPSNPKMPAVTEAALADTDFSAKTIAERGPPAALVDEAELPAPVAKKAPPPLRPPPKVAASSAPEVIDL